MYTVDAAGSHSFPIAPQAAVTLTACPDVATRLANAYIFPGDVLEGIMRIKQSYMRDVHLTLV